MTINSRQKGARHEREVARALRDMFGLNAERGARNGVPGADDVVGWPGVHVECKNYQAIAALKWLEQSIRDAGDDLPIVVMRQNRGENVVMVRLADLMRLVEAVAATTDKPVYPPDDSD